MSKFKHFFELEVAQKAEIDKLLNPNMSEEFKSILKDRVHRVNAEDMK